MPQAFLADPVDGRPNPTREAPGFRLVVQVEVAILLILAVALTVAPQVVLGAVAVAINVARDFSLSYQSAVALIGLLFVAATSMGLWALLRPRRGGVRTSEAMRGEAPGTVGEAGHTEEGGIQRVA